MNRRTLAAAGMGVVAACAVAGIARTAGRRADGRPRHAVRSCRRRRSRPWPCPHREGSATVGTWRSGRACCGGRRRARGRRATPARVARLARRTPEGTANIVLVTGRASDADGRVWVRARLPVLPNGTTGWVPRSALGAYETVRTHLVVDLGALTATLLRDGRPVFRADVGVGQARWPTPRGQFYIRNRLTRYRSPTYGPLAFGTSARSDAADGLARRRVRRHPRDRSAGPGAGTGIARLHPHAQPRHPPARTAHGRRHAGDDPLTAPGRGEPLPGRGLSDPARVGLQGLDVSWRPVAQSAATFFWRLM